MYMYSICLYCTCTCIIHVVLHAHVCSHCHCTAVGQTTAGVSAQKATPAASRQDVYAGMSSRSASACIVNYCIFYSANLICAHTCT